MALKSITTTVLLDQDGPDFFTQTFGTPTNVNIWTLSLWVKLGRSANGGNDDPIFTAGNGAGEATTFGINANGALEYEHIEASSTVDHLVTRAVLKDHTGWHHIVLRYDSTQVTDTDRVRFYLDGIQLTDFSTANWPAINDAGYLNGIFPHELGSYQVGPSEDFDGYMADVFFNDGSSFAPTTYAEQNGVAWQPIVTSPVPGLNGFRLEFNTPAQLGDDTSGEANDWTESGLTTANQREDTPSQNHLTLNQDYHGTTAGATVRSGNRNLIPNVTYTTAAATAALPKTGKYYWEVDWLAGVTAVDKLCIGVILQNADLNGRVGDDNYGWGVYNSGTTVVAVRHNGGDTNFTDTAAFAVSDYFSVAYNADTGDLWFGRNGTWFDSGNPETGAFPAVTLTAADVWSGNVIPAVSGITSGNQLLFRAGDEDFEGTVPNGFRALRVDEWLKPSILDPAAYFAVVSYAGDGTTPRTFTGLPFSPEFAWVKATDQNTAHTLANTVVGSGLVWANDNGTADQGSATFGEIAVLTGDGITVVKNTTDLAVNATGSEYIYMAWKKDAAAGFDVIGYAGTGVAQAIAHSLGVVPDYMYVRNRDSSDVIAVYHGKRLTGASAPVTDPETDRLWADNTIAATDDSTYWNDVAPDASDFTVGTANPVNKSGDNHMAHLWAEVEGFSKFTSYVGTGGTDEQAPFIYCGFRPKLVLIKRTDSTSSWVMILADNALAPDSAFIGGTNATRYFFADTATDMESPVGVTATICDSGLKITQSFTDINASGAEYLVQAYASAAFSITSALSADKTGAGAMDLKFVMDGAGTDPHQHGDGALDLNLLQTGLGSGGQAHGTSAPVMNLVIEGQGSAPIISRANGDGAFDLFLDIDGQGFNTAMRGSPEIPQLTTNGTIVRSFNATATVTLPVLTTNGQMPQAIAATGRLQLPVLQVIGQIDEPSFAILPQLTTTSTLLNGTTIRGPAITIPVLQTVATGISPIILSATVLLPRLAVDATVAGGSLVVSGGVLTGSAVALPALDANGFLLVPQEMAGATITLPALDVGPDAILAPGAIVTASVTLPLLRLDATLFNGVTLVATVWSMNTETLETTNYLNYDFNSLVSFGDQPYGVTATGIFLLAGDDDDGTNIDARVLTGISDRGDENLKVADHMYMQYEGLGMMFQLLPDGQQRLREYKFERRSNSSGVIHARAKGAKGLKSRSWQMGARNLSGGAFTMDKLGLLLRQLTRKTRKN